MKKAALYVRVSTQEQKINGLSIDSQINALRQYCKDNNLVEVGLYNDAGISAHVKYSRRPGLLQMIADCQQGKIDIILVTKLDRFFRSVPDYYSVMEQIGEVKWRSIWEDYETETSAGVFKVNIMLSVAQAEAERTSERIKSVNAYRREKGYYVGTPPKGYKREGNDLVFDPETHDAIAAMFETYLSTFSTKASMDKLAEYGIKINRTYFPRFVKLPAYCGEAEGGYKCPAYITKEQHDLICSRGTARKPKTDTFYLFSGMVYCGYCGCRLNGHRTRRCWGDRNVFYNKYECMAGTGTKHAHQCLQVTEKPLERTLLSVLDSQLSSYRAEVNYKNAHLCEGDAAKKKANLENRLKRLANLYEMGDISDTEYIDKRDSIRIEIMNIKFEPIKEPPVLPDDWQEVYNQLDNYGKRAFWLSVIQKVVITNDNKKNPQIIFL